MLSTGPARPIAHSGRWLVRDVVVDSSVAVAALLPDEPLHRAAIAFLGEIGAGQLEPVVAAHFRFEVRSALVRAAHRGRIGWDAVPAMLGALDALEPTVAPVVEDDVALLGISRACGVEWADAHWVHAAATSDAPLVTADRRLARSVPDEIAIVVFLGDRPLD